MKLLIASLALLLAFSVSAQTNQAPAPEAATPAGDSMAAPDAGEGSMASSHEGKHKKSHKTAHHGAKKKHHKKKHHAAPAN